VLAEEADVVVKDTVVEEELVIGISENNIISKAHSNKRDWKTCL
jgi:hypothetical protein